MHDIIQFPQQGRRATQRLGTLGLAALFLLLFTACIAIMIQEKTLWPILPGLLLLLACFGVFQSSKKAFTGSGAPNDIPVFMVTRQGIGDGRLLIPWPEVVQVRITATDGARPGMPSLGKVAAEKMLAGVGVMDGKFTVEVDVRTPPPRYMLHDSVHVMQGPNTVRFSLGSEIPVGHRPHLAVAACAYARAMGVPAQ